MANTETVFDYEAAGAAARAVIAKNKPLARATGKKTSELANDLVSELWESFNRGVYDPKRSQFQTWATVHHLGRLKDIAEQKGTRKEGIVSGSIIPEDTAPPVKNYLLTDPKSIILTLECIDDTLEEIAANLPECDDFEALREGTGSAFILQRLRMKLGGSYYPTVIGNRRYTSEHVFTMAPKG